MTLHSSGYGASVVASAVGDIERGVWAACRRISKTLSKAIVAASAPRPRNPASLLAGEQNDPSSSCLTISHPNVAIAARPPSTKFITAKRTSVRWRLLTHAVPARVNTARTNPTQSSVMAMPDRRLAKSGSVPKGPAPSDIGRSSWEQNRCSAPTFIESKKALTQQVCATHQAPRTAARRGRLRTDPPSSETDCPMATSGVTSPF
jgi:hypothetical protein